MNEIVFEDPPRGGRGYIKHAPIAAALREKPGQWARVASYATLRHTSHVAYLMRSGRLKAYMPAGTFEAMGRTVDGVHAVYARYVGEDKP